MTIRGADAEFLLEPRTDLGQVVVADRADLADGHRVDGDDRRASRTIVEHEGPDVEAVVGGPGLRVGDVDLGGTRPERCGSGPCRESDVATIGIARMRISRVGIRVLLSDRARGSGPAYVMMAHMSPPVVLVVRPELWIISFG